MLFIADAWSLETGILDIKHKYIVVYSVMYHLTQALTDTMHIAHGAVVIHGELSNKRFLLFLSGKVKIYCQLFSMIYIFSYNFASFDFSLNAFTEFSEVNDKNICHQNGSNLSPL